MNTEPYIVQWNVNGLETRIRIGEIERLITKYNPMCLCLQHLGKFDQNIKNYKIASQSNNNQGELGTAIYVHNSITYEDLQINNQNFQHSSIQLHVPGKGKVNIINFYNQPNFNYNIKELIKIINETQAPKLIVGDINRHSPIWDSRVNFPDADARKIEEMLERDNITCLNEENTYTFFSKAHNKKTSVDISMCSDDITEEWDWNLSEDNFTSDHWPIILTNLRANNSEEETRRYRVNCADWKNYTLYTNNIQTFDDNLNIEESYKILKNTIIEAANHFIPMTSGKKRKKEERNQSSSYV